MKPAYTFIFTILLHVVLTASSSAQGEPGGRKSMIGIYGMGGMPTGVFEELAAEGYGAGIKYHFGIDKRTAFIASATFMDWGEQTVADTSTIKTSSWQIILGAKYYVLPGLFLTGETGVTFYTFTAPDLPTFFPELTENRARFSFPIGLGYQIVGIEIHGRYQIYDSNFRNVSLTLGYNFNM